MFLHPVRWLFICLLQRTKTSSANVKSHNLGLAPSLLLLGKRARRLVWFEDEKAYRENSTHDTNVIVHRPRPGHLHRGDFWASSNKRSFCMRVILIRGAFHILLVALLLYFEVRADSSDSQKFMSSDFTLSFLRVGKRNFNRINAQTLILFRCMSSLARARSIYLFVFSFSSELRFSFHVSSFLFSFHFVCFAFICTFIYCLR